MHNRRTLICAGIAAWMVACSVGLMVLRAHTLGDDLLAPDAPHGVPDVGASWLYKAFIAFSPNALPPAERRLVEFLLLLPLAALVVCIARNAIGLNTFGTFTPALLGLAFRELHSLVGIGVFTALLVVGWLLRRALGPLHLLQVPRSALMLSSIVCLLIGFIVVSHALGAPATRYIALFPLVILTAMIERFWTLEEEDGAAASLRTLLATFVVACGIALVLNIPFVTRQLNSFPETLGIIMAAQLLLGRYTGYRLTELYRFRALLRNAHSESRISAMRATDRHDRFRFTGGVR